MGALTFKSREENVFKSLSWLRQTSGFLVAKTPSKVAAVFYVLTSNFQTPEEVSVNPNTR